MQQPREFTFAAAGCGFEAAVRILTRGTVVPRAPKRLHRGVTRRRTRLAASWLARRLLRYSGKAIRALRDTTHARSNLMNHRYSQDPYRGRPGVRPDQDYARNMQGRGERFGRPYDDDSPRYAREPEDMIGDEGRYAGEHDYEA